MSAAARRWLDRQRVEDGTLLMVLRVLADTSDRNGRCNLSQMAIAGRAGLGERAVRNAISLLEQAGIISRSRSSSGGRSGRDVDLIHLKIDETISLARAAIAELRKVGATGTKEQFTNVGATGTETRVQPALLPAPKAVAPTASRADEESNTSKVGVKSRASGRVWLDRKRSAWRSSVRLDGVDMTLGRFSTEADATRAMEGALADVEHALRHRSGTPRNPVESKLSTLTGADLTHFLVGDFSREGTASSRPPSRLRSEKSLPDAALQEEQSARETVPVGRREGDAA